MNFVKEYILGWTLGVAATVYGLIAMLTGRAFIPGLHGGDLTLGGRGGTALALAYMSGGVFLLLRLVLEKKTKSRSAQTALYMAQNMLLLVFIASLVYILVRIDPVQ